MTRLRFESAIKQFCPPWLRRTEGGRLMGAFGRQIDSLVDRTREALLIRFPGQDPDALPMIGSDRRIRRGPAETDGVYAARLRRWWDDHRSRGGGVALLQQLHAYWDEATEGAQIDVVHYDGTRRVMDGDGNLSLDSITWGGDGTGDWSQVWIFFHLDADPAGLTDDGGSPGISAANAARLRAVPTDWSAAHILRIRIVLLYTGSVRLWGYPTPVPTWGTWGTWGGGGNMSLEINFGAN